MRQFNCRMNKGEAIPQFSNSLASKKFNKEGVQRLPSLELQGQVSRVLRKDFGFRRQLDS